MLKPGDISCMLENDSTAVGTKFMAELDKTITPILAELVTLGYEHFNDHPTIRTLFNWLVSPDRTGEDFYYVVGPLQQHVLDVMNEHFEEYVNPYIPGEHLGRIAAEALAVKCPVLEGPWEKTAWILLDEINKDYATDFGCPSDTLTVWLIHVIADPVLCPNPYLRLEMIYILNTLVDFEVQEQHRNLQVQAVESVLVACSYLNVEYLLESRPQIGFYHKMDIDYIMEVLGDMLVYIEKEFDDKLSKELNNVKSMRLYTHIHDVACHYAINSNKFEEPIFLKGLKTILETIYYNLHLNCQYYKENNSILYSQYYQENNSNEYSQYLTFDPISWLVSFISIFIKSCMTPHLKSLIATCVLTSIEIVRYEYALTDCFLKQFDIMEMLHYLFDGGIFRTGNEFPDYMILIGKYRARLIDMQINCC